MIGYRVAAPGPRWRHVAATALQIAVFWATFLLVLPHFVQRLGARLGEPPLALPAGPWLGAALFVLASSLGLVSAWTLAVRGHGTPLPLATAREFVVAGPYRRLRNPMALAGIAQGFAVGIVRDSPLVVLYALAGALLWHFGARPSEERDLVARFGAPYERYRGEVPLWLPHCRPPAGDRLLALLLLGLAVVLPATAPAPMAALARGAPAAGCLLLALAAFSRRPPERTR